MFLKDNNLTKIILLISLFLVLYFFNDKITTNYKWSKDTQMRMSTIKAIGGPAVPIIAQCCNSRNLHEGIYLRRSDNPGGYCFHSDCDVTITPGAVCETLFTIKIRRKAP